MQRRSTTGVVKENVTDFMTVKIAGNEQKDRTVKKAIKSKGEFEPKQKHVRATILACWRENGCGTFLRLLMQEPIDSDAISAYKGMVITHQVLHEGPSGCIMDCLNRKEMFVSLYKNWERRYKEGYSDPLKLYLNFLINKLSFHHAHPDFTGSLSYEEFLKKGRVVRYEDPNEAIELVKALLNSQELILKMRDEIFRGNYSHVMPAKLSALVPLVVESYNIYTLTVHFLKGLCEVVDSIDAINFLIEKFYGAYFNIRTFYDDCSNVSFVIALIQVPLLPPDPPQFSVNRPQPQVEKKREVREKIEKKPEPTVQDLENQIQKQAPQQPQAYMEDFNAFAMPQTPVQQQYPSYEQQQLQMLNQQQLQQQQQGWATFGDSQFGQVSQPQMSQMDMGFSHLSMNNMSQQQLPDCYQQQQFQQPQPQYQQPVQVPEPQQVEPQEDPRDAQIKDLKRRLLGLQKLFKVEREKRLKAESGVEQLTEQIVKWKVAYENLLKKNEELQAESNTHDARLDEMQNKIFELERQRDADRKQFLMSELSDAARAIELGLVRLNSPTHSGRANAGVPDVADAVSKLLQAIGTLQSAKDAPSRAAALRAIGQAITELLDVIKGVSHLTDDPLIKQMLFDAGRDIAQAVAGLLGSWKRNPEDQEALIQGRGNVESQIEKLDAALKALMAGEEEEGVDFDKFTQDATSELLKAVQAIEDAARRLENARAQKKPVQDPIQGGISDAIMDAAMAIAQATAALVKNARTVQEENIRKGRAGNKGQFYKRDCVWFEGLISAAKAVAASTSRMVACANDSVDGKVDEETLLAASQDVSASTAQLVCSARVRSDPNSESQKRLEDASKAVSSATHHLVEAARRARARKEEAEDEARGDLTFQTPMRKMLAVQEAKANILRLQNQLEKAQKHLGVLNTAEYQQPAPEQ